jgi:hypothetical protein
MDQVVKNTQENMSWLSIWWQQFVDASMVIWFISFMGQMCLTLLIHWTP